MDERAQAGTTILFVDDDETTRMAAQEFLEEEGFSVVLAADGADGLAAFDRVRPALVVTDLQMPELAGDQLVRQIRMRSRDTPVIIITAHRAIDAERLAEDVGADGFLNKPIEFDALMELVDRYAGSRAGTEK